MSRLSMNALADELNISVNTVKAAAISANLANGRGGFDETELRKTVEDYADPARIAGHAASSGKKTSATDATSTLATARARAEEARANKLELEIDVRRGQLVEREAVENTLLDVIARARTQLLNIGHRCASKLVNMGDETEIARIVNAEARLALSELSDVNRLTEEALE